MDRVPKAKLDTLILPSRRVAITTMAAAYGSGPVLVTGEPGVGKTWLAKQFELAAPGPMNWLDADLAPSIEPSDLYRAIAAGLKIERPGRHGDARYEITRALAEDKADGRVWALRIDEAQLASIALLEEIRVLSNRLGRDDGFSALVIIGQTPLSRRLDRRALGALEARLAAHVHLKPIDADEARALLDHTLGVGVVAAGDAVDLLRAAGGNPKRLLRIATASIGPQRELDPPRPSENAPAQSTTILPTRPPLHVEEGVIEVGWDAESDAVSKGSSTPTVFAPASTQPAATTDDARAAQESQPTDEPITDHYAALQAWNEWAQNRGRQSSIESSDPDSVVDLDRERDVKGIASSPLGEHAQIWAEGQHGFAPYSQLFSRGRQARDRD
jgi:general secretion pathway protein A